MKVFKALIWVTIAAVGALPYAVLTRLVQPTEHINALWLVVAAACTYVLGYRFYGTFIAGEIFGLDDRRRTPAIRLADGPLRWGTVARTGARVILKPADGAAREITIKEEPFRIGRTWDQLIMRSELVGLRLWDPQNARKEAFPGLRWFEVKDELVWAVTRTDRYALRSSTL